jgi:hypothetical protein
MNIEATANQIMSAIQSDAFDEEACEKILRDAQMPQSSDEASRILRNAQGNIIDKLLSFVTLVEPWVSDAACNDRFGHDKSREIYSACVAIRPIINAAKQGERDAIQDLAAQPKPESWQEIVDECLENVIEALGQCQKGTARQFILSAIERSHAAQRKPGSNDAIWDEPAAQTQPSKASPLVVHPQRTVDDAYWEQTERSDQPPAKATGDNQEWIVKQRPSGLEGIEGLPSVCLQICKGDNPITHGLEVTHYNMALLTEATVSHNAELADAYAKSEAPRCDFVSHLTLEQELASERELHKETQERANVHAEQCGKAQKELATERQRREQAEGDIADAIDCLDGNMGVQELHDGELCEKLISAVSAKFGHAPDELPKLRQQLLSALAAIEKHNEDQLRNMLPDFVDVDLSALREHDAEVKDAARLEQARDDRKHYEAMRKLLVEALEQARAHSKSFFTVREICDDALAKVK